MNKKGFTLIELLAVIIILGILMIIAIPSVTKYINDSRKSSYIDTARELIGAARNVVNEGKLEMYDTDATYYIDIACLKTENGGKAVSPYGDFVKEKAYVVVTFDGKGYDYYWTSIDESGQGIKNLIKYDNLDPEIIESDLKSDDILIDRGLDGRSKVILIREANNCQKEGSIPAGSQVDSETGEEIINKICRRATSLHSEVCNQPDSGGCHDHIGNGTRIYYGNLGTKGNLPSVGDAFDCDVNNDGVYDSNTERFYYVISNGNKSVLIYYANISNDGTTITSPVQSNYRFSIQDPYYNNYKGPNDLYQYLPSKTQWSNSQLIEPGTRQLKNEKNELDVRFDHILGTFTYTNKAARLLTVQEINAACNITVSEEWTRGELDSCSFFYENIGRYIKQTDPRTYGFWLETPSSLFDTEVFGVNGSGRAVIYRQVYDDPDYGLRPAIEVLTSHIDY